MQAPVVGSVPQTIEELALCLQNTLSPDRNIGKAAEQQLSAADRTPGHAIRLLQLVEHASASPSARLSAAVAFKNMIKRHWRILTLEETQHGRRTRAHVGHAAATSQAPAPPQGPAELADFYISESERDLIKENIIELMARAPAENIQRLLSDAVSVIGREDFPAKWPNLLRLLVDKFGCEATKLPEGAPAPPAEQSLVAGYSVSFRSEPQLPVLCGVLHTAYSLFQHYTDESRTNELLAEIVLVVGQFAAPFTALLEWLMAQRTANAQNGPALRSVYQALSLTLKIYYCLVFQDMPEFFEDHLEQWMRHTLTLLTDGDKPLLESGGEEAGLQEEVRAQICENLALLAHKESELFTPYMTQFVQAVWELLMKSSLAHRYDLLTSKAIEFLTYAVERPSLRSLFAENQTLQNICDRIVIPNMQLRNEDMELFEDNAEEYIRRDLESSDVDTRRRAAVELVRALCRSFEQQVIQSFSQFISSMLQICQADRTQNWAKKNVAVYLVTTLAARGQTQQQGVTQSTKLVDLEAFFREHILPEFVSPDVNELPVLKADALKYLIIFRNQLAPDLLNQCVPHVARYLTASSVVVRSYAGHALERLFLMRDQSQATSRPLFGAASGVRFVLPLDLSQAIFGGLIQNLPTLNEYAIKALMRALLVLREHAIALLPQVLSPLVSTLFEVSKNPSKPQFNHFMFESLCIGVRLAIEPQRDEQGNLVFLAADSGVAMATLEQQLFPLFQMILQGDVVEFSPYSFQVIALMLSYYAPQPRPSAPSQPARLPVPPPYLSLFPFLLTPMLWERAGNVPALTRLLCSYATALGDSIEDDKLSAMFGVVQSKLLNSKVNDHHALAIVTAITDNLSRQKLASYLQRIFLMLFQRLQAMKTAKYQKLLVKFLLTFADKHGAALLIETIDSMQSGMFQMMVDRVIAPDLPKWQAPKERALAVRSLSALLGDVPTQLPFGAYGSLWMPLLSLCLSLLGSSQPNVPSGDAQEDERFVELATDQFAGDGSLGSSYDTPFSLLVFAGVRDEEQSGLTRQSVVALQESGLGLARALARLSAACPGQVMSLIASLQPQQQVAVQELIRAANVQIL